MTLRKTISLGAPFGLLALVAIVIIPNVSAMDMSGMGSMADMQNTMQAQAASHIKHPTLPVCTQVTVPVSVSYGVNLDKTYTVPTGFKGDPSTANGQCIVDDTDYSTQHACIITNGIATSGHCEAVNKGWEVTSKGSGHLPTEEWFKLGGTTLQPGQYLDLVDTTPFMTTMGHMATILPCDDLGQPRVRVYEGIIDAGVNTLEPADIEYLQHISDPGNGICAYHFNIGTTDNNPDGVSDFVIMNPGTNSVTFTDRNTSTFSAVEGYLNDMG